MSIPTNIRLNKFISNSGICNRRQADDYISQGRVTVNDRIINKLGSKVSLNDLVKFDGKEVSSLKMQYIILNKPKGPNGIHQTKAMMLKKIAGTQNQ